jgi:hypothetical protein
VNFFGGEFLEVNFFGGEFLEVNFFGGEFLEANYFGGEFLEARNPRGIYESLIEVLAAAPILVLVRGFRTYIGMKREITLHLASRPS